MEWRRRCRGHRRHSAEKWPQSIDIRLNWEYFPNVGKSIENAIQLSLARLLRPLVQLLLRFGLPYGTFAEVLKRVYVDVALKDFTLPGRKPTISRASVITGLSRKEVLRITRLPPIAEDVSGDPSVNSYNRAIRVISGWVRDADFTDADGRPAPLPFEGGVRSFSELVRRYSGDVTPRAILDELLRVGSVEERPDGDYFLRSRAYVPAAGDEEKFAILGADVADLVATIDHNLKEAGPSRLQLKVSYDNLPGEPLAGFRRLSAAESRRLLERFDRELSAMDRDTNPESEGSGRYRAGVSIYYFEEPLSDDES